MAVQRDPTAAGKKQMAGIFASMFDGVPTFIAFDRYRSWYGIDDKRAAGKFEEAWKAFCSEQGRSAPKLYVGQLSKPKGYLVVRQDRAIYNEKKDQGFFYSPS